MSSHATQQELASFYPQHLNKSEVVLLSSSLNDCPDVDLALESPVLKNRLPRGPYCVFSGSLEPRKNVDRLLQAFENARKNDRISHDLVLVSGGGWDNRVTLETIGRLRGSVHLLENLSEPDKAAVFRGADFVALPSLHEGFGIPIVEGLKLGKPVLTSHTASMPEVAGAAGEYVDPLDTQSIEQALIKLCTDQQHRDELARSATALATTFSWRTCAEQTMAAFRSAIVS